MVSQMFGLFSAEEDSLGRLMAADENLMKFLKLPSDMMHFAHLNDFLPSILQAHHNSFMLSFLKTGIFQKMANKDLIVVLIVDKEPYQLSMKIKFHI